MTYEIRVKVTTGDKVHEIVRYATGSGPYLAAQRALQDMSLLLGAGAVDTIIMIKEVKP